MATTTAALATGGALQSGDAGSRGVIEVADVAEVAESAALSRDRNGFVGEIAATGCPAVEQAVAADDRAAGKLE
jgi:hypothetical protein